MRHLFVIFFLLILVTPSWATTDIDTLADFMQEVRWMVNCSNDDMLPDSTLIGFAKRAILWTSVDLGGIEAIFRIVTVNLQEWYAFPDTVTQILSATLINAKETHSIKSFTPAYYEDAFRQTTLESGVGDQVPQAYQLWADSIQLIPPPIKVDSIYFKCYVEHPYVSAVGNDILLRPGYIEAALEYCCYLVYKRWEEFDKAAVHLRDYEALGVKLTNRYKKPMEALPR